MPSRRRLVEEVIRNDARGQLPFVPLACGDDDAQGQTPDVFWNYEIDRRLLSDDGWTGLCRAVVIETPARHWLERLARAAANLAAAASMLLIAAGSAAAQTSIEWQGVVDNNWGTAGNWSPATVPDLAATTVLFRDLDALLNNKTITLGADRTVGTFTVSSANNSTLTAFTIAGNTLNFNNNGAASVLSLSHNRSLIIASAVAASNNLTLANTSAYGGVLTLSGPLSMGNHALAVDVSGGAGAISGVISGTSGLSKTGVGTLGSPATTPIPVTRRSAPER